MNQWRVLQSVRFRTRRASIQHCHIDLIDTNPPRLWHMLFVQGRPKWHLSGPRYLPRALARWLGSDREHYVFQGEERGEPGTRGLFWAERGVRFGSSTPPQPLPNFLSLTDPPTRQSQAPTKTPLPRTKLWSSGSLTRPQMVCRPPTHYVYCSQLSLHSFVVTPSSSHSGILFSHTQAPVVKPTSTS